jgi:hypothetical protein
MEWGWWFRIAILIFKFLNCPFAQFALICRIIAVDLPHCSSQCNAANAATIRRQTADKATLECDNKATHLPMPTASGRKNRCGLKGSRFVFLSQRTAQPQRFYSESISPHCKRSRELDMTVGLCLPAAVSTKSKQISRTLTEESQSRA